MKKFSNTMKYATRTDENLDRYLKEVDAELTDIPFDSSKMKRKSAKKQAKKDIRKHYRKVNDEGPTKVLPDDTKIYIDDELNETRKVKLSAFINAMNSSLAKEPRVKNYDKIQRMVPQLEKMLKDKGDFDFDPHQMASHLNMNEQELDEVSVTAGVGAYDIPSAFRKGEKERPKAGEVLGYKKAGVSRRNFNETIDKGVEDLLEITYKDYKVSEGTPKRKINRAISEMNSKLFKLERMVNQNLKLKNEYDMDADRSYWKASMNKLNKISERMIKISEKIRRLGE